MKTCPACAKQFYKGRKALVQGTMRTVCLGCSEGALRVVCTVKHSRCCVPHCNETATTCNAHVHKTAQASMAVGSKPYREALQAAIRGMHHVLPKSADAAGFEHAQGKLEGLESALEVILQLDARQ